MGHGETAEWLLDHGASIDLADNGDRTAAFYAAKMGNEEMLDLLLERGSGGFGLRTLGRVERGTD